MGEKITINGKEYTERKISFIEINGTKFTDGMITTEISKGGPKISANIQVDGTSFKTASNEFVAQDEFYKDLTYSTTNENINQNSVIEKQEISKEELSENWIARLIKKIKNIFTKKNM